MEGFRPSGPRHRVFSSAFSTIVPKLQLLVKIGGVRDQHGATIRGSIGVIPVAHSSQDPQFIPREGL